MKRRVWQLQEAKNRFSEVVNRALDEGPQVVTRRGEEVVVILGRNDYNKLRKSQSNLVEFFRQSPLVGVELGLDRDRSRPRAVLIRDRRLRQALHAILKAAGPKSLA